MKNKYEIRGDVTAIFLKVNDGFCETLIDTIDIDLVNSIPSSWCFKNSSNTNYVRSQYEINGKRTVVYLHRLLMNPPKYLDIDHINHNGLDNRRSCNLRVVSSSQNSQNLKGARSDNPNGKRGVMWNKQRGKWQVTLHVDGKAKHFGFFDDLEESEKVAKHARAKYMPTSKEAQEIIEIDEELISKYTTRPFSSSKSGIRGVSWNESRKEWRASFIVNKINHFCGWFKNKDDAAKAIIEAKKSRP